MSSPEETKKETEFEKLRVPIQEIIGFTNTLEERYREKCFEILLKFHLRGQPVSIPQVETHGTSPPKIETITTSVLPLPIRAFLNQNNIPVEKIGKLFLIENGEVVPTYKIQESKKAAAQIQLAMLSALKNALSNPASMFEFSIKDIRELCKENNVYDLANFTANFKKRGDLFKDLSSDEEHVKLTPDGKTELAETIVAVSS